MTKPNLDEKRKAAVFEYSKSEYASTEKVMGEGYHPTLHFDNGFIAGAEALYELLRDAGPEFDQDELDVALNEIPPERWEEMGRVTSVIFGARWQHQQLMPRVAALEAERDRTEQLARSIDIKYDTVNAERVVLQTKADSLEKECARFRKLLEREMTELEEGGAYLVEKGFEEPSHCLRFREIREALSGREEGGE